MLATGYWLRSGLTGRSINDLMVHQLIAPVVCRKEASLAVQATEDQFSGDFSCTSRQYQRVHYCGNCL